MRLSPNNIIGLTIFVLALVCGWLLMKDAIEPTLVREKEAPRPVFTPKPSPVTAQNNGARQDSGSSLNDLISVPNERLVRFSSEAAFRRALTDLEAQGFKNLGHLDRLRAIRVGYRDLSRLRDYLGDDAELFHNFYSAVPQIPDVSAQPNAIPIGNGLLEFLGIREDNSNWGEGVTIALVDTGVSEHITLNNVLPQINVTDIPSGAEQHPHGTGIASVAVGSHPNLRGVAPAATLQPLRVANSEGVANDWDMIEAFSIVADQNIPILVTAMGGPSFNPLMQELISSFGDDGPAIFAPSGNDGIEGVSYPAGYEGVFSVGAVDANGILMNFSNRGENLDFVTAGFQVNAAFPGDRVIAGTGTSYTPSQIGGAVAEIFARNNGNLSPIGAAELFLANLNEGGPAGFDIGYGNGILDIGRAISSHLPNREDLALASQIHLTNDTGVPFFQVNVQNQGTATSTNANLTVDTDHGSFNFSVGRLDPGAIETFEIPTGQAQLENRGFFDVTSSVNTPTTNTNDVERTNNTHSTRITTPEYDQAQAAAAEE